ncbi:MAG: class II fructose-bisphosphate aldolase [Anaerolineae bacterium]|nr:class II fructose-bisphosphate aldolase [Anaerolineae bacterium]
MPLTSIPQIMRHALSYRYAVGYFESWNLESLQGVIDAAEQRRAPIIIGFNGEFLSRSERIAPERLDWYGALGKAAAESASVPVGFIFNECPSDAWVRRAITAGFNLVMPVPDEGESAANYQQRTRDLTRYAHESDVAVEAELGTLPFGETVSGTATDPAYAAAFVAATGVDLLAVSVGNVHVLLHGQKALDLDKIAAIRKAVDIPLVLHGGTGISADSLRAAIALGVAKVNYGTYVKRRYLDAVRRALQNPDENPHHLLGYGADADVLVRGRLAVRDAVLERIDWLGCIGKADVP